MKNKKAQSMSTNTIILLILGLAVLVVLILGFTSGWKVFNNIISPTNVDSISEECSSVCGLQQKFGYCSSLRNLRINEEKIKIKASCAVLASTPSLGRGYVDQCGSVQCDVKCSEIYIEDNKEKKIYAELGDSVPEGTHQIVGLATDAVEGKVCYIKF